MSRRLRHLQGGPALIKFNDHKVCRIAVTNTAPYSVTIGRHEFIGGLDQWNNVDEPRPLDSETVTKFINKMETKASKLLTHPSELNKFLSDQEIADRANLNVPDNFKEQYLQLLRKHRKVISVSKTDLGRCKTYKHKLYLKDDQPVYHKQFPLKPDHQSFVEQSLQEWLRSGWFAKQTPPTTPPYSVCLRKGEAAYASFKTFEVSTPKRTPTSTP